MNERGHLSTQTLDLLALSALAAAEAEKARAHLGTCAPCKRRWDEVAEDKQRFEQFVFPRTVSKVEARAQEARPWFGLEARWRFLVPALGFAAAAAVALFVLPRGHDPYVGLKGGSTLQVVARRGDAQFEVKTGSHLKAKDQLRFVVEPAGARYLLVASRDGRGALTIYFPYGGTESGELRTTREELPGSIELDDAVGPERLYALFSDAPLRWEDVKTQLVPHENEPEQIPGVREAVTREFVKDPP